MGKKIFLVFICLTLLLSVCIYNGQTCEKNKKYEEINIEDTNNKIDIKFTKKLTIGEDTDNINYIFGTINDITIDNDLNIYILDRSSCTVKKYNKNGRYITTFGGKGKGPGEFMHPRRMAINNKGEIYVTDDGIKRVTVFDKTGMLKKTKNFNFRPFDITIDENDNIFIQKWPLVYRGEPLINKYDKDFQYIKSFCKPWKDIELGNLVIRSGSQGIPLNDKRGRFIYCCNYPYRILQFDREENLLNIINRKLSFLKKPYLDEDAPVPSLIRLDSEILNIVCLQDNFLMINIRNQSTEKPSFLFEFYSDKNELLASIPSENILKHPWIRVVKTDNLGNIYFDYQEPYPHVVKYKVELTYK